MRYLIVEVFEWTSHQKPPFLVDALTEELLEYINEGQYGCYDTLDRKWMWGEKNKWIPVEVKVTEYFQNS
jgi:hypothetical protein